jgi:P27 family predicted phage terminase small subunit
MIKTDTKNIKMPNNLNEHGKVEFKRIKKELLALGYLEIDQASLIAYLTHYGYYMVAKGHIDNEGLIITTPNGHEQTSQWFSIMNNQSALMLKYIKELGLSSASRKTIGIKIDDCDDGDFE